jgi:NAD(P)H dehydrogenase (quinone)
MFPLPMRPVAAFRRCVSRLGRHRGWAKGAMLVKVGSMFMPSATQHGGQGSTILSFHASLLHLGMVIVGLSCAFQGQTRMDELTGCSP